jgi:signal transduction histidine kinase
MNKSLLTSSTLLRTLIDLIPVMAGYWPPDLKLGFANQAFLQWFDKSAEAINGIHMRELIGNVVYANNEPYIRAALAGQPQEFEQIITLPNGETREILTQYIPNLENNEVSGFFSVMLNITERKHLEKSLVSIDEERIRTLGQELHDNLGQQLAAIGYQSGFLAQKLQTIDNPELVNIASSIATQAQSTVKQCKQLAQGLLPFELDTNGLTETLHTLTSSLSKSYGITCNFVCDEQITITNEQVALNLYRITQEAINNAVRHGQARNITVLLSLKNGILHLSILDDGIKITDSESKHSSKTGMGIKIMKYRASQINATLQLSSPIEGGTVVHVEMKLS